MVTSYKTSGSDDDLLRVAREDPDEGRRRRAAGELLRRYRDAVYGWCVRYTRDPERALDISQEVLTVAWQRIGSFEGRSRFSSWIFTITRNRCIDASRRVDIFADGEVPADLPDPALPADVRVEHDQDEQRLLETIRAALDPLEQDVVWLWSSERMRLEDITTLLKIEGATGARAVLQRARRKLRAALDRDSRDKRSH
jgi:RNA polymerase sigma factor (sigma-70 family)